jgi:hypothetical protein
MVTDYETVYRDLLAPKSPLNGHLVPSKNHRLNSATQLTMLN